MFNDKEKLCLITYDKNLAKMILSNNNQETYRDGGGGGKKFCGKKDYV